MKFYKRAITSIKRKPGKTLILFLLIAILGSVISGAIAVEGAISNTEANLRRSMRPIVSFDLDGEALQREIEASGEERFDLMTVEMVHQLGRLPYVAHYDYSIFTELGTDELQDYRGEHGGMMMVGVDGEAVRWGWFHIRGTSLAEPQDMRENLIELTSGMIFSDDHLSASDDAFPVLISNGVALENDLGIGSVFTIDRTVYRPIMDGDWDRERTEEDIFAQITFEFEVVGLFDPLQSEIVNPNNPDDVWEVEHRMRQLNNNIYVPNFAAERIQRFEIDTQFEMEALYFDAPDSPFGDNPQLFQTVMLLHDIDDLENFRNTAMAIIPDLWYVTDLTGSFSEITTSMSAIQEIADWILIISIGATLLILSLLITLFLKDRRHEIGVYLVIGERKIKIISQILIEVVTISIAAMVVALLVGHFISSSISTTMIRNELETPSYTWNHSNWETGLNALETMGLDTSLTFDEMIAAFDVSLSSEVITHFFAIGIGAVILSTVIPVLYIVFLKPKKVLL